MRILIATLMASSVAAFAFSAAQAADAVEQIPQAPAAYDEPAPVSNWTGAYVGATGSYDWGRFNGEKGADGFGGAGFAGYNWQNGQIVYGVEGDLGYNDQKTEVSATADGKQRLNGSVRARVGYDMNPFMIYGTGGIAASNNKLSDATSSDERTVVGYTVGAGVEALVTNNVTARVEYRYSDFQDRNYVLDSGNVSRGFDDHSVKVGVGVKF